MHVRVVEERKPHCERIPDMYISSKSPRNVPSDQHISYHSDFHPFKHSSDPVKSYKKTTIPSGASVTSTIMKFQVLLLPLAALAITVTASPVDPEGALAGPNIAARGAQIMHDFEKRKGCSKRRLTSDVCEGKKLQPQHSFHNW